MIADKQLQLSNAQAVTASAASTNQIDLGPVNVAGFSTGRQVVPLMATIDTTFTAGGAATLSIGVRSSANANMSSPTVHSTSPAIPVASLSAGADLKKLGVLLDIPENSGRYVDVYYTVATGPMTAGAITVTGVAARPSNVGV